MHSTNANRSVAATHSVAPYASWNLKPKKKSRAHKTVILLLLCATTCTRKKNHANSVPHSLVGMPDHRMSDVLYMFGVGTSISHCVRVEGRKTVVYYCSWMDINHTHRQIPHQKRNATIG